MYKNFFLLLLCIIVYSLPNYSYAQDSVSRQEFFLRLWENIQVPSSYKYIELYYKDVEKETELYDALQKIVYLGKLPNKVWLVKPNAQLSAQKVAHLLQKIASYNIDIIVKPNLTVADEQSIESNFQKLPFLFSDTSFVQWNADIQQKLLILEDVYNSLKTDHIDWQNFTDEQLIDWAIKWLAHGSWDPFTTYLPTEQNKNFQDSLQWSFVWIGAYLWEVTETWLQLREIIENSPAEKSWLLMWDIVVQIDDYKVNRNDTPENLVQKIQWPIGSRVVLTIQRQQVLKMVSVTRWKVTIPDLEYEQLNNETFYIQLRNFDSQIAKNFQTAIKALNQIDGIEKLILDLRSNPGGYLDQTQWILSSFVKKWDINTIVEYKWETQTLRSLGYNNFDTNEIELVVLINENTASASEIVALVLKDYFPNTVTLVGKTTYGKWSVQTQRYYDDGSALKYTVAKWYSGKNKKSIDKTWLEPDIEVEFDSELYKNEQTDSQLQKALTL